MCYLLLIDTGKVQRLPSTGAQNIARPKGLWVTMDEQARDPVLNQS